jgi:hypothetical protein
MPRNISDTLKDALLSQMSDEGILPFLTIAWNDGVYSGTIRLVLHDADIVSGGNVYVASSFDLVLPDEDETEVPKMQIMIADIDESIREQLQKLSKPATVTLRLALFSNPDANELTISGKLRVADIEEPTCVGEIHLHEDISTSPYPAYRFSRAFGFMSLR